MEGASNLESFIDSLPAGSRLRVESDLGDGFVRLRVSEAERRQAKQDIRCVEDAVVEMLRNARDAHARTIVVASSRSGNVRRIVMVDDGDGVPERLRESIFEPRVTSKLDTMKTDEWGVHGRGMALYSIRENALRAECLASVEGKGSVFLAEFDCSKTPEKSDQSTAPELLKARDGSWSVGSGPHNIVKTTAEFAIANRQACTVYLGSMVDAAATCYAYGKQFLKPAESVDERDIAPLKKLGTAHDASEVQQLAAALGFDISSRSAHRIVSKQVTPLPPMLEALKRAFAEDAQPAPAAAKPKKRKGSNLQLSQEDAQAFSAGLKQAFSQVAASYYLEADIEPEIRVSQDAIHVNFPVVKL